MRIEAFSEYQFQRALYLSIIVFKTGEKVFLNLREHHGNDGSGPERSGLCVPKILEEVRSFVAGRQRTVIAIKR
jgi:hypothetical protein